MAFMSALDGWIDVCRTGTWRDAQDRQVDVTDAMLDGLAAGYGEQDPAPVVVGHPAMDAPAYAWVEGLRKTGDRLQAKLRDIAPAFREAVEAGAYAGRSIAIKEGKLRHVGFLGGRAPAVPGLAPTQFAAEPDREVRLAEIDLAAGDLRWGFSAMARIARGMRERIIATDSIEAADETIPAWEIDALQRAADEAADGEAVYSAPQPQETEVTGTPNNPPQPDEAALAARSADLDAREARVAESERAAAAAARRRAADTVLEPHVAAGRILPAERPALAALFASLPDDDTVIAFAAPEGDGEVQEKPRAVLERLFGAIPARVPYGELAGGAVPTAQPEDSEAIAAEARVLMSEAEGRGETLTATEAVRRVRAKRGLGD